MASALRSLSAGLELCTNAAGRAGVASTCNTEANHIKDISLMSQLEVSTGLVTQDLDDEIFEKRGIEGRSD